MFPLNKISGKEENVIYDLETGKQFSDLLYFEK